MLDSRRLEILLAVARAGSFSAAARELDYTQPAISHHIRQLEAEVGTPLLVRTPTGARLTEAGQALAQHAEIVAVQLATAEEELAAFANLSTGRVRVAAFPSASATLVPDAARQMRESHPGVAISLVEVEPPEAIDRLKAGEVDVAITFDYPEYPFDDLPGFEASPLLEDESWLLRPTSRRAGKAKTRTTPRPPRLESLADQTWIAGCPRCRSHLLHLAAIAGFVPRIAFATDDVLTVQALVATGLGIAILPALALNTSAREDISYVPLDLDSNRRILVVASASPRPAPAVGAMMQALRTAAAHFTAHPFTPDQA